MQHVTQQTVYFVTGTDTDVGKTYVSRLLLQYFNQCSNQHSNQCSNQHVNQSSSAIGYKPIAAGASMIDGELKNEDALSLQSASASQLAYRDVNPICFKEPIAPHIASELAGKPVRISYLNQWWELVKNQCDIALIEGAGGWRLPLNNQEYLSDFVKHIQCEVIVVVGMKLGCLNHALLTFETIQKDGLVIKGWVANQLGDSMDFYDENLAYLKQQLDVPFIGEIKSNQTIENLVLSNL